MKSGTIRARKIAYCFLFRRRQEGKSEQCSAGNDWRPAEVLREGSGIKARATPLGRLCHPETLLELERADLCHYNPAYNLARLRPPRLWCVTARIKAWLRYWRLCRWWRALS